MHISPKPPPRSIDEPPPLLLGSHAPALYFEPDSIPAPPGSQDASVINDGGDTKQLEFIAQQWSDAHFESKTTPGYLVAGAGGPSSGEWKRSVSPSQPGSSPDATTTCDSPPEPQDSYNQLGEDLHQVMVPSEWLDHHSRSFLPFDKLGEYITKPTIEYELRVNGIPRARITEFAAKIVGITPSSGSHEKTTRRKLFAILVMINKVPTIVELIKESVLDSDLPFILNNEKRKWSLWRKPPSGEGPLIQVEGVKSWSSAEMTFFDEYQWRVLAPFLQLSSPAAPKVHHYPLDPRTILPFIAAEGADGSEAVELMGMGEFEGGFSEVRKVKIHEHHHNLFDPNAPGKPNPHFAVKILKKRGMPEAFWDEVNCLKRLMEANNSSLVRLLGTFEHCGRYHLIFPWADANLEDFWEQRYPDPAQPPRNVELARWMARELSGLASGLKLVHSSPIHKDNKQELAPVSKKIYGRHGDIKPTNILWFQACKSGRANGDMGHFQIADFGFTAFHSKNSIEQPAHSVGRSPTHRAPECDGLAHVSPSSDFWSLGAVLLEFVVWYIHGWQGWKFFAERRAREDTGSPLVREDKYFNRLPASDSSPANQVEVKQCVLEEIKNLRSHQRCSPFLSEVLDVIEKRLLVIKQEDRVGCDGLVETFGDLNQKCIGSSSFCMGKEVEGKEVKGKEVEGKEVKGKEVEGKEVEGKEVESKEVERAAPPELHHERPGDNGEGQSGTVSVGLETSSRASGPKPPSRQNSWKPNKQSATRETRDCQACDSCAPGSHPTRRRSSRGQYPTPPAAAPGAAARGGGWTQAQPSILGKRKFMEELSFPPKGVKIRRRSTH